MAWRLPQLDKHLQTGGELKPVYLLAGDEHLLVFEAADALRKRAREAGYSEREVLDVESGFDWNDLARAGATLSLFATRRLIDLRLPTGRPGKEGGAAITEFCEQSPPDTILLITASTWSKQHEQAWVRSVESVGVFVPVWPLSIEQTREWIAARAIRGGLRLTSEAVDALAGRVEGNLLAAAQEIDKLVLLTHSPTGGASRALDAAELEAMVADNSRFDVFKLVDAALGGDAARALRIAAALRAEGESVPGLVAWFANQLNLVLRLAVAVESGSSVDQTLRGERGVWQSRYGLYRSALARGRAAFWEARLAELARVEKLGKGRGIGDAWLEFERLIASIADSRIARAINAA